MQLKETTISSREVYRCPVFRVTENTVLLPNGKTAPRDCVLHNGGSGVLPIADNGDVILVEQYRYGVGMPLIEIPAGKLEAGEDPAVCAMRELGEEVGGKTDELIPLGSIAVTPAYDSEIIYIYLARCNDFAEQHLDEDEFLKIHRIPLAKALEMVLDGTITDAKTQIALLKAEKILRLSR